MERFLSIERSGEKRGHREGAPEQPPALEDLVEMALAVVRVQLEELAQSHGAPFRVDALAAPLLGRRGGKELGGGLAVRAKEPQHRGPDRGGAVPRAKGRGPSVLVVAGEVRA